MNEQFLTTLLDYIDARIEEVAAHRNVPPTADQLMLRQSLRTELMIMVQPDTLQQEQLRKNQNEFFK